MKIGLQNTDWEYIGARLANEDDSEQAKFFSSFVKEAKSWGTRNQAENQFNCISRLLTRDEIELLSYITYIEER